MPPPLLARANPKNPRTFSLSPARSKDEFLSRCFFFLSFRLSLSVSLFFCSADTHARKKGKGGGRKARKFWRWSREHEFFMGPNLHIMTAGRAGRLIGGPDMALPWLLAKKTACGAIDSGPNYARAEALINRALFSVYSFLPTPTYTMGRTP